LACEPKPDANIEGDINAFLNSLMTDTGNTLAAVVKSCEAARQVAMDLVYVNAEARALKSLALSERCETFIQKIKEITSHKIEIETARILQYADEYIEPPSNKGEVKVANAAGAIKVHQYLQLSISLTISIWNRSVFGSIWSQKDCETKELISVS